MTNALVNVENQVTVAGDFDDVIGVGFVHRHYNTLGIPARVLRHDGSRRHRHGGKVRIRADLGGKRISRSILGCAEHEGWDPRAPQNDRAAGYDNVAGLGADRRHCLLRHGAPTSNLPSGHAQQHHSQRRGGNRQEPFMTFDHVHISLTERIDIVLVVYRITAERAKGAAVGDGDAYIGSIEE
jgi:hypothetical protein